MTWNIAAFGPSAVNSFTPILPTNIVSIKDINGSANNAPKAGTAKPNISFVSDPSSIMESFTNLVVATVVVDAKGRLVEDPIVTVNGVYDAEDEDEIEQEVMAAVAAAIDDLRPDQRRDDSMVGEMSRRAVRRCIRALCGKKPHTEIHLVRG